MANIEWTQITSQRFVSKTGQFSIAPDASGENVRFELTAKKAQGYTKVYRFKSLEAAFWGASNIYSGGRGK